MQGGASTVVKVWAKAFISRSASYSRPVLTL